MLASPTPPGHPIMLSALRIIPEATFGEIPIKPLDEFLEKIFVIKVHLELHLLKKPLEEFLQKPIEKFLKELLFRRIPR